MTAQLAIRPNSAASLAISSTGTPASNNVQVTLTKQAKTASKVANLANAVIVDGQTITFKQGYRDENGLAQERIIWLDPNAKVKGTGGLTVQQIVEAQVTGRMKGKYTPETPLHFHANLSKNKGSQVRFVFDSIFDSFTIGGIWEKCFGPNKNNGILNPALFAALETHLQNEGFATENGERLTLTPDFRATNQSHLASSSSNPVPTSSGVTVPSSSSNPSTPSNSNRTAASSSSSNLPIPSSNSGGVATPSNPTVIGFSPADMNTAPINPVPPNTLMRTSNRIQGGPNNCFIHSALTEIINGSSYREKINEDPPAGKELSDLKKLLRKVIDDVDNGRTANSNPIRQWLVQNSGAQYPITQTGQHAHADAIRAIRDELFGNNHVQMTKEVSRRGTQPTFPPYLSNGSFEIATHSRPFTHINHILRDGLSQTHGRWGQDFSKQNGVTGLNYKFLDENNPPQDLYITLSSAQHGARGAVQGHNKQYQIDNGGLITFDRSHSANGKVSHQYQLEGFSVYLGTGNSGHYQYVQKKGNHWFLFDGNSAPQLCTKFSDVQDLFNNAVDIHLTKAGDLDQFSSQQFSNKLNREMKTIYDQGELRRSQRVQRRRVQRRRIQRRKAGATSKP